MPDSAVFVECYIVSVFDNLSALLSEVEVDEATLPLNVPESNRRDCHGVAFFLSSLCFSEF